VREHVGVRELKDKDMRVAVTKRGRMGERSKSKGALWPLCKTQKHVSGVASVAQTVTRKRERTAICRLRSAKNDSA
jgi:hypothetical protein